MNNSQPDFTHLLPQLEKIAEQAARFYKDRKTPSPFGERLFASAVDGMGDYLSGGLREIATAVTGGATFHRKGIVATFCGDEAFARLNAVSISPYWFWKLVELASQHAANLPLEADDVDHAVHRMRSAHQIYSLRAIPLTTAVEDLSPSQVALFTLEGVLYVRMEGDQPVLCRNPLWSDDKS